MGLGMGIAIAPPPSPTPLKPPSLIQVHMYACTTDVFPDGVCFYLGHREPNIFLWGGACGYLAFASSG